MCEAGFEGVSVTAVRRLGYQEFCEAQSIEEKLNGLDKAVAQMEESARATVEASTGKHLVEDNEDKTANAAGSKGRGDESQETSTDEPVPLSSPSGMLDSASLSSSTWGSNKSVASSDTYSPSSVHISEPLDGDASNGRLDVKTIWFNFASPPPISIHKKVDFTRLVMSSS